VRNVLIAQRKPESYAQGASESGATSQGVPMKQLQAPALIAGLERKSRKRKADRDRAKRKRSPAPRRPRGGPPPEALQPAQVPGAPVLQEKAFSPAEREQWLRALLVWITEGGSLRSFCEQYPQGPARCTWLEWIDQDAMMAGRYVAAREHSADSLAEECVSIADSVKDAGQFDSARVNAARLMVDARKWVASKLKPKTYADRLETVTSGTLAVTHTITDDDRARALASLLGRQAIQGATSLDHAQRLIEATARDVTPKEAAGK